MLILIPAILMISSPALPSKLPKSKWSCMATGVTREGQNQNVAGPSRPTKSAAKEAAVVQCRNEGLMSCGASFCTEAPSSALLAN